MVSAAAYLKDSAQSNSIVHANSNCDMLFAMSPLTAGWRIDITTFTSTADRLKAYLKQMVSSASDNSIDLR
jgi:hypothetical protein